MKKIIEKMQLVHIVIILLLIILIIFGLYQYTSAKPKKINIDEIKPITYLADTDYTIQDINEKLKLITCSIDVSNLSTQKYFNYITGEEAGIKVNCNIILKIDETYYKLKTLLQESARTITKGKINLKACIKSKYLKENYEILLYDNESQKAYKYSGGRSEETIKQNN